MRPDRLDQTRNELSAFVDRRPRLDAQLALSTPDVDDGFRHPPDAHVHALVDADEFDAELCTPVEVLPQQRGMEIAEVVRRSVGREVGPVPGAQARKLGEPFLVASVDIVLPGHPIDGAPGQRLLHPVAGFAEQQRPDGQGRVRAGGDSGAFEQHRMLGFEPGAGDDLDELEAQGHGSMLLRGRLGEWGEGLTPVGGGGRGRGSGLSGFGHEAIFSLEADLGAKERERRGPGSAPA